MDGLTYDAATGDISRDGKKVHDSLCSAGYKRTTFQGKRVRQHRLAAFLVTGKWPEQVDHINGNKQDNRWENLRVCDAKTNNRNLSRGKNNQSGITGVRWASHAQKYKASITVDGRNIHLGYFHSIQEAAQARAEADVQYGFHANHGRA